MSWKNCFMLLCENKYYFISIFFIMTAFIYKLEGVGDSFSVGILFSFFLLLLSIVDWRKGVLPDCILLPMGSLGLILQAYFNPSFILSSLICALLAGVFFFLLYWVSRQGIGAGDIKFAFVLGLWLPGMHLFFAMLLSFWMGGATAILLLLIQRKKLRDKLPFGPFMSIGSYLSFLFANEWFEIWMELNI